MPLSPGYTDYVAELLSGFGPVEIKRMFGGAGVYRDGVMFALVDDDVVYFRVDEALEADLKAQGCTPWVYSMKSDGAVRDMGYWSMPESAADDPDEAADIARRSFAAALKRKAARKTPKPRAKKPPAKGVAKAKGKK